MTVDLALVLRAGAWLSIMLMGLGLMAVIEPDKWWGLLFPAGLALFWAVGVAARRRARSAGVEVIEGREP